MQSPIDWNVNGEKTFLGSTFVFYQKGMRRHECRR